MQTGTTATPTKQRTVVLSNRYRGEGETGHRFFGLRRLPPSPGKADGAYLPILQAVENQFDAARNTQFVEDTEQVISDDLLLARGMAPRGVVLLFYALTTGLVCAGWVSLKVGPHTGMLVAATCWGVLGFWAVHLGALRSAHDVNPVRARRVVEQ